jgi:quercetin dioxygenase-like cupin family protein
MDSTPSVVWMPGGVRTEIHLDSGKTNGAFCLLVDYPPAGWSLPPHLHRGVAETIYVVDGEFEMTVDELPSRLSAGQTIHIPPDVIHSGGNAGATPGQRVVIFSPAGMEQFFLELGTDSPDTEIDVPEALASAIRHGWRFPT